jgi:hypothetical protein
VPSFVLAWSELEVLSDSKSGFESFRNLSSIPRMPKTI